MYRIITEKIIYNNETEYINWINDKPKLKKYGYIFHETSTELSIAEKECILPLSIRLLVRVWVASWEEGQSEILFRMWEEGELGWMT